MSHTPIISIVVPLYNKKAYVRDALMSIKAQSFVDFEVIVIDDGSTDGGATMVSDITLPYIRLVRQENGGVSRARNRGVELAKADLVAFLDADDTWNRDHLRHLYHLYRAFPDAALYANGFVQRRKLPSPTNGNETPVSYRRVEDFVAEAAAGRAWVFTSAAMVRREIFAALGGFPAGESRGEDLDLWIRIGLTHPVALSSYPGCTYRRVADGLTSRPPSGPDVAMRTIARCLAGPAALAPLRKAALKELSNRIALAHAADCLLHGDAAGAQRFLDLSSATDTQRRRRYLLQLLTRYASFGGAALLRLWVGAKALALG